MLSEQLSERGTPLDDYLAENSYLPGPAGNLTLIYAAAEQLAIALAEGEERVWDLLARWAGLSVSDAPAKVPKWSRCFVRWNSRSWYAFRPEARARIW